jgi:hypothetical protein
MYSWNYLIRLRLVNKFKNNNKFKVRDTLFMDIGTWESCNLKAAPLALSRTRKKKIFIIYFKIIINYSNKTVLIIQY